MPLTDGVMSTALNGDAEFGANAIRTAHQNGIGISNGLEVKRSPKSTDLPICTRSTGRSYERFDGFH